MAGVAVRLLLVPVFALAGIGTASAYLHFAVGAVAGLDGIAKGRYFLGPSLSLLCAAAAFALWRVWLIDGRLWRHGAYIGASPRDRSLDAAGVVAAATAALGFVAIAKPIERADEVVFYAVLLVPAALVASIAFAWAAFRPRANPADAAPPASSRLQLTDVPGLVSGTALGLLGVYFIVPRPRSGWGVCELSVLYPLRPDLWPEKRPMIFDACATDALTLSIIAGALSLLCLAVGAVAAAIGRDANATRGGRAAALVVAVLLTVLIFRQSVTPDGPYYGWAESVVAGALVVLGAGWLGFVGGIRGARWRQRRAG